MIIGKTRTNQPVEGGKEFEDALLESKVSMENVVDADGHKRFIEGDITFDEIAGLTQSYGKWSLSGSHLLIVIAGGIANTTALNGKICDVGLPAWVKSKLVAIYGSAVLRADKESFANDGSTKQNFLTTFNTNSVIYVYGTATADRLFRWEFDLLIDNE